MTIPVSRRWRPARPAGGPRPAITRSLGALGMVALVGVSGPTIGGATPATPVPVRRVFVGGAPDRVAVGPHGIWVGDLGHLARVDPTSDAVAHVAGATTPIGVGPDVVWAGVATRPDAVARIDPTGAPVGARIDLGGAPAAITIGAGAIWVLDSGAVLTRIDPTTNAVTARVELGGVRTGVAAHVVLGAVGFGLAAGDGAVWASGRSLDNTQALVWRVDPTTATVVATIPTDSNCATLAGSTDAVWAACGTARRIDAAANQLVDSGADAQNGVAVGEGAAWALGPSGTVTRLDPQTGRALTAVGAPNGAEGIAAGAGALWLADPHLHQPTPRGAGTLLRLRVPAAGP